MKTKYAPKTRVIIALIAFVAMAATTMLVGMPASAQKKGKNGTTLAASKTIDICEVTPADGETPAVWRISGEISVWNEGAVDTEGLKIVDCLQNKVGTEWVTMNMIDIVGGSAPGAVIPAGTTLETATTFEYSFEVNALEGDIRNVAKVTITNHSGSLGTAKGPEPKATWLGEVLPCGGGDCADVCNYSQGYWKNHTEDWPEGFDPNAEFFLSGKTWLEAISNPGGSGYNQLAAQYIAALLNQANGACVDDGVQTLLDDATEFFETTAPTCTAGSCYGTQKTWAAILEDYNTGDYPGGPEHCGDEE